MGLQSWLKWPAVTGDNAAQGPRSNRVRLQVETFESRAMPSANPAYAAVTGPASPFNGFDVGTYSVPKHADLDGDGDLDLAVGETNGALFYFENTGTAGSPTFVQRTGAANPLNGIDVGTYSSPAFGDLDGDGDLDLVSGNQPGTLFYYENTGTAGSPTFAQRTGAANPFNGLDVGNFSTPEFGDLDGDGDLDLVSGDTVGKFHCFRNTGTANSPTFASQTGAANPFNGFDVGAAGSVPALGDVDGDGDLDLVAGGDAGTQFYYENMGTAGSPTFAQRTGAANPFNGFDVGTFSAPTFGDLNGDGALDLVSGNSPGTLNYYQSAPGLTTSVSSLNLGTTTAGTAGTPQTFTVGGIALGANLVVTAPAGVELSTDGTTWHASRSLTPVGGKVADTTISARTTAAASAGAVSGNITVASTGATTLNVTVSGTVNPADTTPPTATVVVTDTALAIGETSLVTATFSEAVTGFTAADLTVANGVVSGLSTGDGGVTWTGTLTPIAGATDATNVVTLDLTGVQDLAANAGTGTASSNNYAVDTQRPTVAVTSSAAAVTGANPIPVTATFSEPVTGFTAGGVTVGNGAVSNFVGSGTTYTFDVTPSGQGAVTVDIGAGAGQDAVGNGNTAATQLTRTFDSVPLTAAVTTPAAGVTAATGGTGTNTVAVTYTDGGSGVDPATVGTDDLTVSNGATVTAFSAVGNVVTYTITAPAPTWAGSAQGTYTITLAAGGVVDLAGNPVAANASLASFTVDTAVVPPPAAIPPVAVPPVSPPPAALPPVSPHSQPVLLTSTPTNTPSGTAVRVLDPGTGQLARTLIPFAGFMGQVDSASGDLNGDGVMEVVAAAGAGGGPHVKVFDGASGRELASFYAYAPNFLGGVCVAVGDVNGDGTPDLVTGAGAGGSPHVKVFDGRTFAETRSFLADGSGFAGGVNVAVGDVNGDGFADIVTGAGAGGAPHVVAFSGANGMVLHSFLAYGSGFAGGVNVAVGDVNGDGFADIVTGAGVAPAGLLAGADSHGGPHVKVFDGRDGRLRASLFAFDTGFPGGVRVGTTDADGDGKADIVAAAGSGGGPHVKVFDGETLASLRDVFAGLSTLTGGVSLG